MLPTSPINDYLPSEFQAMTKHIKFRIDSKQSCNTQINTAFKDPRNIIEIIKSLKRNKGDFWRGLNKKAESKGRVRKGIRLELDKLKVRPEQFVISPKNSRKKLKSCSTRKNLLKGKLRAALKVTGLNESYKFNDPNMSESFLNQPIEKDFHSAFPSPKNSDVSSPIMFNMQKRSSSKWVKIIKFRKTEITWKPVKWYNQALLFIQNSGIEDRKYSQIYHEAMLQRNDTDNMSGGQVVLDGLRSPISSSKLCQRNQSFSTWNLKAIKSPH